MDQGDQDIPRQIESPLKEILVVSGRSGKLGLSVMSSPAPMVYSGFLDFTYSIQYIAPGPQTSLTA